jgi:hypothetical protein
LKHAHVLSYQNLSYCGVAAYDVFYVSSNLSFMPMPMM